MCTHHGQRSYLGRISLRNGCHRTIWRCPFPPSCRSSISRCISFGSWSVCMCLFRNCLFRPPRPSDRSLPWSALYTVLYPRSWCICHHRGLRSHSGRCRNRSTHQTICIGLYHGSRLHATSLSRWLFLRFFSSAFAFSGFGRFSWNPSIFASI